MTAGLPELERCLLAPDRVDAAKLNIPLSPQVIQIISLRLRRMQMAFVYSIAGQKQSFVYAGLIWYGSDVYLI